MRKRENRVGFENRERFNRDRSRYSRLNQWTESIYNQSSVERVDEFVHAGRRKDEQTLADEDAEFVSDGAMDWAALGSAAINIALGWRRWTLCE